MVSGRQHLCKDSPGPGNIQLRLCQLPACWLAGVCLAQAPSSSELCSPSCEPCFWEDTHYTRSETPSLAPSTPPRRVYILLSIVFSVLNTNTAPIYLRDLLKENNRRTLRSNSSAVKLDVARTIRRLVSAHLLSVPRHDGIRSLLNYVSVTLWHPLSASSRLTFF